MNWLLKLRSRPFLALFCVWLLANGIGTYLRLYPLLDYVSPEAYDKGALLTVNNLRKKIDAMVDAQYPFLSKTQRHLMALSQFNKTFSEDTEKLRNVIYHSAQQVEKTLPPHEKTPYLQASDSYYYLGLTEDILKTGTISESIKGSKFFYKLMQAPLGHWEPLNLHPYLGAAMYHIVKFFKPDASLMYSVSFTPLIVVAIAVIPFLLICATNQFSLTVCFIGAVNMLTTSALFERSLFSWYDDDPYNILFPLTILCLVFFALKHRQQLRPLIWCGIGCSFFIPLYALFWQGWVLMESILALCGIMILVVGFFVLKEKKLTPGLLLFFFLALGGAFVGVGILFGFREFFILFQEGWTALSNFTKSSLSLWPDLYIAVGELLKSTPQNIIATTGGYLAFAISVGAVLVTFGQYFRRGVKDHLYYVLINLLFLLITGYLALGAKRFTFLAQVPLILLFPLGLQYLFKGVEHLINQKVNAEYRQQAVSLILAGLAAILIIAPIRHISIQAPSLLHPIFNEVWEKALTDIAQGTPSDSIVNTWWPPGHFIKTFAKRRVTFDGATINVPQSYWLANVFISSDERQALGMLRMLNNSADEAVEYLVSQGFKLSSAVSILKAIAPLSISQAREKLQAVLNAQQTETLLKLTHSAPPPSYLLVYNEIVEKNIQLTYVGHWDFAKVERINADPKLRKLVPRSKSREYIDFIWKISGGQNRYSGELAQIERSANRILFEGGILVDLDGMSSEVNSKTYGKGVPSSIVYLDGDQWVVKEYPHPNLSYSLLLIKRQNEYACILTDTDFAKSLLLRLYYFQGKGLKYLKPFCYETNMTRRTEIMVYEVDWQKFFADLENNPAR